MSKPLELKIYPPLAKQPLPFDPDWQGWDAWREWKRLYDQEFQQRRDARLTDAELAAEWWRSNQNFHNSADGTESELRALAESVAVHRFATTPHYFEVDQ